MQDLKELHVKQNSLKSGAEGKIKALEAVGTCFLVLYQIEI